MSALQKQDGGVVAAVKEIAVTPKDVAVARTAEKKNLQNLNEKYARRMVFSS